MKSCNRCLDAKPLEMFAIRKESCDGRRNTCKACVNLMQAQSMTPEKRRLKNEKQQARRMDPEVRAEKNRKNREFKAANRERIRAEAAIYRAKNAEARREYNRKRYQEKRDEILEYFAGRKHLKAEYDRARVIRDKAILAVQTAKWKRENKDLVRSYAAKRRARKANSSGSYSGREIARLMCEQSSKCNYCHKSILSSYHADHIMPLALGGSNDIGNIQLLCPSCNLRKADKHPDDFALEMALSLLMPRPRCELMG